MARATALVALMGAAIICGCTTTSISSHDAWFARNGVAPPSGNLVYVCHAFGCLRNSGVRFSDTEMARITAPFAGGAGSPQAEREAISLAVQHFEDIVGQRLGTSADTGGFEKIGGGDPTQMDCIDEASNTTTLLVLLSGHGHLVHHDVRHPASRGILIDGRYPHNTAVVSERSSGRRWAIDSWPRDNGEAPVVQPLDVWLRERSSSNPEV